MLRKDLNLPASFERQTPLTYMGNMAWKVTIQLKTTCELNRDQIGIK